MNPKTGLLSPLVGRCLMSLAFFAIPLAFIGFELLALRQSLADEVDAQEQGALLNSLRTLKTRQNLRGDCQEWFTSRLSQVETASDPRPVLAEMRRQAPRELGLPTAFLVLRPDGQPDEELSDLRLPDPLKPFLASDFRSLERRGKGRMAGMNQRFAAYQDFFGPWVYRLGGSKELVGIHQVRIQEKRQSLYVSPESSWGRLFVFLDQPPDWNLREIRLALSRRLVQSSGERGAVLHPNQDLGDLEKVLGPGFATSQRACALMGPSTRQAIRIGDWLWAQVPIDQTSRVILGRPDHSQGELDRYRRQLLLLFTALFIGAALAFFRLLAAPDGVPFRLSTRLFLLLIYVVGLPLLVYGLSARSLGRDLNEVRQRQWHTRQVALLEELDQRFLDMVGTLETTLSSRLHLPPSEKGGEETLKDLLQETVREFRPASADYLNAKGKAKSAQGWNSFSLTPALRNIVFTACTSLLGVPAQVKPPDPGALSDVMAEGFGVNLELMICILTEFPERLLSLDFVSYDMALLVNTVYNPDGTTPFVVLTGWNPAHLRNQYLERFLPRFQAREPTITLATRDLAGASATIPALSPFLAAGEEVLQGFREARRPVTIPVPLGSTTWLLTGFRGPFLKGILSMAGSPSSLRDAADASFHRRIALIGFLLALSGVIIARLLSAAFLGPIRELAQGVDALARRDFSHRIPPIGQDELGHLGIAFNQMLEDLKDLELAHILQERIYPTGVADLGHGWEIYGDCRSASQVGGDFFDFFPLPDGRWFIGIGDVSGHGTPSALIVAMAKGLFSHPRNLGDPGQNLQDAQAVFGQVLPRKRMMMTCFVALFDPATGHVQFSNAGHNYPYLVDPRGVHKPLKMLGFPLGHGRKRKESQSFDEAVVEPGGFLFLYTDGFVEALDPQGSQIGYDAVQERFPTLLPIGAQEGVGSLRAWHDSVVGPGPQADDITLVLLKQTRTGHDSQIPPAGPGPVAAP